MALKHWEGVLSPSPFMFRRRSAFFGVGDGIGAREPCLQCTVRVVCWRIPDDIHDMLGGGAIKHSDDMREHGLVRGDVSEVELGLGLNKAKDSLVFSIFV